MCSECHAGPNEFEVLPLASGRLHTDRASFLPLNQALLTAVDKHSAKEDKVRDHYLHYVEEIFCAFHSGVRMIGRWL